MNKKKKFQLKSKHLLFIMTFLCLSGILGSAADKMPVTPIREAAGFVIIPFQNGINQIGAYLTDCLTGFQNVKKLSAEKEELEQKVTNHHRPQHHDSRPVIARRVAAQYLGEVFPAARIEDLTCALFYRVLVQHRHPVQAVVISTAKSRRDSTSEQSRQSFSGGSIVPV